ncbi:glyoxalase/bleomycin resistance/extradiol dioxygenase family protein [Streptosporangium oxazolinicum]|uniref:Glyoxalase/bleomycin resistance/extradiol dioxygenase family protein n=1 Tax=Streptosporangium oxazolinicum TaxID=909287 RepID=A0ABP8AHC2_9ACTN
MIHASLIVVYTDRLDACHAFYTGLGLTFAKERHGAGPEHYAATLGGTVFELYPAGGRRPVTGSLRLGFTVPAGSTVRTLTPGRHVLTDPDGRVVDLHVIQEKVIRPGEGDALTLP